MSAEEDPAGHIAVTVETVSSEADQPTESRDSSSAPAHDDDTISDEKANSLMIQAQRRGRRKSSIPSIVHEGWLQLKEERKILGVKKASWTKMYSVLDPELWSLRFFKDEQAYFNDEESGDISLQHLKSVTHMIDKSEGRRFNVVDFDGKRHGLLAEDADRAAHWVRHIAFYKSIPLPGAHGSISVPRSSGLKPEEEEAEAEAEAEQAEQQDADDQPELSESQKRTLDALKEPEPDPNQQLPLPLVGASSAAPSASAETPETPETAPPVATLPAKEAAPELLDADSDASLMSKAKGHARRFTALFTWAKPDATFANKPKQKERRFTDLFANNPIARLAKKTEAPDKLKDKIFKRMYDAETGRPKEKVQIRSVVDKSEKVTRALWSFELKGTPYEVELQHGDGKRTVQVNGEEIHSSKILQDDDRVIPVQVGPVHFMCIIQAVTSSHFNYNLLPNRPLNATEAKKSFFATSTPQETKMEELAPALPLGVGLPDLPDGPQTLWISDSSDDEAEAADPNTPSEPAPAPPADAAPAPPTPASPPAAPEPAPAPEPPDVPDDVPELPPDLPPELPE